MASYWAEGGLSLDSRSADKEKKALTPEKSKAFVLPLPKKLEPKYQLLTTRSGRISLISVKLIEIQELFHISK